MRSIFRPIAALNAIVMILLCWLFLAIPMRYSDEALLVKWSTLIKKNVFGIDPKPDTRDLLFIDVSANKMPFPRKNALGMAAPYDSDYIVNRTTLTDLLRILNQKRANLRYVFMDILFQDRTIYDPALQEQIDSLKPQSLQYPNM